MELTRTERWILANQFRLLEALYPQDAKSYARNREVVERGYEPYYDGAAGIVNQVLGPQECSEVREIVRMFQSLESSYRDLPHRTGVDEAAVKFAGFSASEEDRYMYYARFVCTYEEDGRYAELNRGDQNLDSHLPMLERYRQMLIKWKQGTMGNKLSWNEIRYIVSV